LASFRQSDLSAVFEPALLERESHDVRAVGEFELGHGACVVCLERAWTQIQSPAARFIEYLKAD
jgi:hypothetical protein